MHIGEAGELAKFLKQGEIVHDIFPFMREPSCSCAYARTRGQAAVSTQIKQEFRFFESGNRPLENQRLRAAKNASFFRIRTHIIYDLQSFRNIPFLEMGYHFFVSLLPFF